MFVRRERQLLQPNKEKSCGRGFFSVMARFLLAWVGEIRNEGRIF